MATLIQQRRGTAATWTTVNPVLAAGEMGFETDTKKFKFGDGTSTWTALAYDGADKAVVGHTHTVAQLSDATALGRSILQDATAADVRATIGAGTSNLAIGSTGTTAKAGDWFPSFAEVTGTIGTSQLPALAINDVFVVATQAAMLALTAQRGDIAVRTDTNESFILSTDNPGTLADWKELLAHGQVISVAGKTGAVTLVKADVGLGNVDNTADTDKPVSTATQTALNLKANLASPTFTGTVSGVTKAHVGLGNVDNTADSAKPVSTAQQTALNAKENSITAGTTAQYWRGDKTWQTHDKASVGLSAVDNTSDASKPVSTAQQTALNLKANLASPTFTGTVSGITKAMVGLGSVDNTSDAAKPVSTATQTALNGKANTSHTHVAADIISVDGGAP